MSGKIGRKLRKNSINNFTSEEFQEYLNNAYLQLGDTRNIEVLSPLTTKDWHKTTLIPEMIVNYARDPHYLHFVAQQILNVNLLPIQCAIQQILWNKRFPLFMATRGGAKSFLLTVYIILRALLHQGANIVVVGAGLRQSMVLWHYLYKIWDSAPILQDIVGVKNHPKRELNYAYWECGLSRIIFLPLGNGEKIRGMRACVGPNTLIETNHGLIRIKDSSKYMDDLLIHVGDNIYEQPLYFLQTKPIDAYEVTTTGGYNFICSDIHQVMTTNGWKLAKDLTNEDFLPFDNDYKFPNNYLKIDEYTIDENFAFALGILVSEGSVSEKHSISVKMTDKYAVDSFEQSLRLIDKDFNICRYEYEARIDPRGWECKPTFEAQLCNLKFRDTLVKCGLDRITALFKNIPDCILRSPKSVVISFLKGLFWGDGSCYLYKDKTRTNNLGITYYSSSKQLIDDIQVLLTKLGLFVGKSSRMSKLSKNPNYFLRIYGEKARILYNILEIPKWKTIYDNCFKDVNSKGKHSELRVKSVVKLDGKHILYDYTLPHNQCFIGNCFKQHNTHIIADELASLPSEILETVVRGFASVKSDGTFENVVHAYKAQLMEELNISNNIVSESFNSDVSIPTILGGNQIVMAGTAFYQFNHIYKYYQYYNAIIRTGGDKRELKRLFPDMSIPEDIDPSEYAVIRLPYDAIPLGMMDKKVLDQGRATMDPQIFGMEYGCIFPSDSEGFYLASIINKATCPIRLADGKDFSFSARLSGDKKKFYVMGIDPASESDNFAICIIEINETVGHVVYSWTTNRKKFEELKRNGVIEDSINDYLTFVIKHIRHLTRRFNISLICCDAGGGGLSVREGLRDPSKMIPGERIIQDMDLEGPAEGEKILKMIHFSDAAWRKDAHWGLKTDLFDRKVLFPYYDQADVEVENVKDSITGKIYDTLEDTYDEIQQTIMETTLIRHSQTVTSQESWDVPKIKGVNAEALKKTMKRDRFTSLLLANWARRLLIEAAGGPTNYIEQCYGGVARNLKENTPASVYQAINVNSNSGNRRIMY